MKIDFKCEIKTVIRWQKVTGNKRVIATEPNHLTVDLFRNEAHVAQRRKTVLYLFGIIFFGEMEQKQAIWCLKLKSLNINLLFIFLF